MSVVVQHKTIAKFSKASFENVSKEVIIEAVGDLSDITVMQNMVLVATYIRPEKVGGVWLPDSAKEEDVFQGKVGLVLKTGPSAFIDTDGDNRFGGLYAKLHDWCVYRVGDSWDLTLRKVPCRLIRDDNIRLIINDPEDIF